MRRWSAVAATIGAAAVAAVLAKLGVASRREAATHLAESGQSLARHG